MEDFGGEFGGIAVGKELAVNILEAFFGELAGGTVFEETCREREISNGTWIVSDYVM